MPNCQKMEVLAANLDELVFQPAVILYGFWYFDLLSADIDVCMGNVWKLRRRVIAPDDDVLNVLG